MVGLANVASGADFASVGVDLCKRVRLDAVQTGT